MMDKLYWSRSQMHTRNISNSYNHLIKATLGISLIDTSKPEKSVVKEYNDQGGKTPKQFNNKFKICQVSASGMSHF